MFVLTPLAITKAFLEQINETLMRLGHKKLSVKQSLFIATCITGIIITNSICWQRFSRCSFGCFCSENLSKMFRRSPINWSNLLKASISSVLKTYDIREGVLVLDDTINPRCKQTSKIAHAHKMKDKKTGGFVNGQAILILLLITEKITIPVGFCFYEPDPNYIAWKKEDRRLRKQGVSSKDRPEKPVKDVNYLTKPKLGGKLLKAFQEDYPEIKVKAILADALYGCRSFMEEASQIYPMHQIISQIRGNQKIQIRNRWISVEEYFRRNRGVRRKIVVRGGETKELYIHGARLKLKAHGCTRFIIAVKYEGEEKSRYLLASNLSWRLTDIMEGYTLRWLVEVFIQDWKTYEGWCQLAKQQGAEGACRGVTLSLLTDHCLLVHEEQKALINNKLPAATVGSLRDKERARAVIESIENLINNGPVNGLVQKLHQAVETAIPLRYSSKHMSYKEFGRLEPTPTLQYRANACA